ncbi:MAG: preprotein translocase subunit YajC, partial [Clostridia bacterium]|nr:preprotein translocase subunit YajC [Clostridia bacterium]
MLNFLCADASANGWYLPVIMLVVVVLIGCVSYIPQRKRKKEYMQMINSVRAGKIIKTAGGFIGEIVSMDEKNGTFELNVGTKENPVIVVLVKGAIAEVMNPDPPTTAAPKQEVQANGEVLPTAVTADD